MPRQFSCLLICMLLLTTSFAAQAVQGDAVYKRMCASCHGIDGKGRPGLGGSLHEAATLQGEMDALIEVVMNGVPGSMMMAFKRNMDDPSLAAAINYLRSTYGREGASLSAADIAARR